MQQANRSARQGISRRIDLAGEPGRPVPDLERRRLGRTGLERIGCRDHERVVPDEPARIRAPVERGAARDPCRALPFHHVGARGVASDGEEEGVSVVVHPGRQSRLGGVALEGGLVGVVHRRGGNRSGESRRAVRHLHGPAGRGAGAIHVGDDELDPPGHARPDEKGGVGRLRVGNDDGDPRAVAEPLDVEDVSAVARPGGGEAERRHRIAVGVAPGGRGSLAGGHEASGGPVVAVGQENPATPRDHGRAIPDGRSAGDRARPFPGSRSPRRRRS